MKANRSFIAHRDGVTRRFRAGEVVPKEWWSSINVQSLVDKPLPHLHEGGAGPELDPFPGYHGLKTIDDVIGWVHAPDDWEAKQARAAHALERELSSAKPRKRLIEALSDIGG